MTYAFRQSAIPWDVPVGFLHPRFSLVHRNSLEALVSFMKIKSMTNYNDIHKILIKIKIHIKQINNILQTHMFSFFACIKYLRVQDCKHDMFSLVWKYSINSRYDIIGWKSSAIYTGTHLPSWQNWDYALDRRCQSLKLQQYLNNVRKKCMVIL